MMWVEVVKVVRLVPYKIVRGRRSPACDADRLREREEFLYMREDRRQATSSTETVIRGEEYEP